MKIVPVARTLADAGFCRTVFIDTAQHNDPRLDTSSLCELFDMHPDIRLPVEAEDGYDAFPQIYRAYDEYLAGSTPAAVIVPGDVHASSAVAMVAAQRGIPVVHLEAGLRCADRTLPEEINRRTIDAIASLFWTHCEEADAALADEGVPEERIECVGNTMIDALIQAQPEIRGRRTWDRWSFAEGSYVLVTLHRASNVDEAARLGKILTELGELAESHPVALVLHPRTRQRIEDANLSTVIAAQENLLTVDALEYSDFASALSGAAVVVTDSGGVQEESSYLGIPCLTLRESTERPVTIRLGTNRLVNLDSLLHHVDQAISGNKPEQVMIPQWDGKAADRCADSLNRFLSQPV